MTTRNTTIDGYTVDLDTDMDGDGTTGCWVSYKALYDEFTASLACLIDTGVLTANSGREWVVDEVTIDRIEVWAEQKGY